MTAIESFSVIIPTLNGGDIWKDAVKALKEQSISPQRIVVIDSGSTDGTAELAMEAGFELHPISKADFDHGGTRQMGINMIKAENTHVVLLTQDAVLANKDSLKEILTTFEDPKVAVAYGRQLPRPGSGPIEAHARLFNYPAQSIKKDKSVIPKLGIKTAFCSNSYSAYDIKRLMQVGGFPSGTIFAEDMIIAAKLIDQGFSVSYSAEADCYHSHEYTITEEFKRSFDIGVFHRRESWLLETFGGATGEGMRFVKSELAMLAKQKPWLIPDAMIRTLAKYSAYKLGKQEHRLPNSFKQKVSLNGRFWRKAS